MNLQEQERERAAEQWLDQAIAHLRSAGPRAGLETRIMAGLRAHAMQRRRRWTLALAGAFAAVVLGALLASRPRGGQSTPEIVQQNPADQTQVSILPAVANVKQSAKKRTRVHEFREAGVTGAGRSPILKPALEAREATFPSAAPLNEQGRLLQAYLRQTPPRELALIAARQPSLSSLESEDLNIAPLQIADLTAKAETTKDQDQN